MKRLCVFLVFFVPFALVAQRIELRFSETNIPQNGKFTITIFADNATIKNYSEFPRIDGFRRSSPSSSTSMSIINGVSSSSHSISVSYYPVKQGTFKLNKFSIRANGKTLNGEQKLIKVGPAMKRQNNDPFFPFSRPQRPQADRSQYKETKLDDDKLDIQLKVVTDKDSIYERGGVNVRLVLSLPESQAKFIELRNDYQNQIFDISSKIKSPSCFVEDFNLAKPIQEIIKKNGKRHLEVTLWEAQYFPFNTEEIDIPEQKFLIDKFLLLYDPVYKGSYKEHERVIELKTNPKTVFVKELPEHPLRDKVSVGSFFMQEKSTSKNLKTGENFRYGFLIHGEGNISAVDIPQIDNDTIFTFLSPNIKDQIEKQEHKLTGSKQITYTILANRPGDYNFGDYFSWIYFNTDKSEYDTLRSSVRLHVEGEPIGGLLFGDDSYTHLLQNADNSTVSLESVDYFKIFVNTFACLVLCLGIFIWIKKRRKDE